MAATMLQLQLAQKLMESALALRLHSGYSQPVCVVFSGSRPSCSSILCMCAAHATTRQRQDLAQDYGTCPQHARSRMLTLCPVWPLLLQEPPLRFPAWPFGGGGVPAAASF